MKSHSIGLAREDFSSLLAILQLYIPKTEVWAFGSRVRGTARPFSDLDLVVVRDRPLSMRTRAELEYALSESELPMKIDLVEWARASKTFREIILKKHLVVKPKAIG